VEGIVLDLLYAVRFAVVIRVETCWVFDRLSDFPAVAALLVADEFGQDAPQGLSQVNASLRAFSFVARRDNQIRGCCSRSFNRWHVFASPIVVAPAARRQGMGRLLVLKRRRQTDYR
jgi:N-acetylglutamate synthase-like GNAT family acetyltransferase